jgi:hypothetical protein
MRGYCEGLRGYFDNEDTGLSRSRFSSDKELKAVLEQPAATVERREANVSLHSIHTGRIAPWHYCATQPPVEQVSSPSTCARANDPLTHSELPSIL